MAGVDIVTVQKLLGHKTLTMTLRYAHLADAHRQNAIEVLERRLSGQKGEEKLRKILEPLDEANIVLLCQGILEYFRSRLYKEQNSTEHLF